MQKTDVRESLGDEKDLRDLVVNFSHTAKISYLKVYRSIMSLLMFFFWFW